jgi:hypothetical protein
MMNFENKEKKLVIYSVITGGYDEVLPVNHVCNECEYYIISNNSMIVPEPWELIVLPSHGLNNKDFNRFYKINPHLVFKNYHHSLYVDGNILLYGDLHSWSLQQLSHSSFAIFNHPERDNIFDEGRVCAHIGTDYFWVINKQLKNYKENGFVSKSLYEANILLRSHNEEHIIKTMSMWWQEYINMKNSKRDQIALPYVLWKENCSVNNMGPSDARFGQNYFKYMRHHNNRHSSFSVKLKKIINRTIGKYFHV